MKKLGLLFFLCIFLVGCKEEIVEFGTVEYYPGFLWVDSKVTPVIKTMECDFNIDAQNDANSFAEFQFVDNDGKPIQTSEMQVKVDGIIAERNTFRVNSNTQSVKLEFTFSPNAKTGKHQGFLKLVNHKLDRIDSQPLSGGQNVDVFQWTLNYDKDLNPIEYFLYILLFIIFIYGMIRILYSHLRRGVYCGIDYIINGSQEVLVKKRKANRIVISSKVKKQNWIDWLFNGKTLYNVEPVYGIKSDICFNAARLKRTMRVKCQENNDYYIDGGKMRRQILIADENIEHIITDTDNVELLTLIVF